MTYLEMADLVGKEGYVVMENMRIAVRVLDVRVYYGNTHTKVEPLNGEGTKWIDASRFIPLKSTVLE